MDAPRLSVPPAEKPFEAEKIARSESLSALFSYFQNWAPNDPSLKFREDSVVRTLKPLQLDEVA